MKKVRSIKLLLLILAAAVLTAPAFAQNSASPSSGALPNLPEANALVYFNLQRILNDALPRVLPEKLLTEMRTGIDQIKQKTGIDLYGLENATIAMKFNQMTLSGSVPDFVLVMRGSFNADALLSLMRIGLQGKYQEQKHGSNTVTTLKLSDLMGPSDGKGMPSIPGLNEISVTALDAKTIAAGNTAYLKATIDAQGGRGVIKPELTALAMREPSALFSAAGLIPPGLLAGLVPKEAQGNEEITKLISGIDQAYLSFGMDAANFTLLVAVRTGSPEHARTLSGLVDMATHAIGSNVKDKAAKEALDSLKVTLEGAEVQLRIAISQETVASFARGIMQPQQKQAAPATTAPKETQKKPAQNNSAEKSPAKKP